MGRPKIAVIDDSAAEESESQRVKKSQRDSDSVDSSELKASDDSSPKGGDSKKATAKSQKPGKAKPRSKKYQEISKDLDRSKTYPLNEALEVVKKLSYSKFESSLEAHINTAQTGIRGLVSLPFASGKKLKILAFGEDAKDSGADVIGTDEVIEQINKGKVDFDLVVTTPQWMPKLAKVARILGPRSLMPNPKNGTITSDLKKAVEGFQAGKTEYKTESKAPVIHITLGKLNQPTEELSANIKTLVQTVGKTRVKKISLTPTMGPSVKVDLTSV
ncbi:50S ribosomal protein L1 [Candidatus Daviesbacteria bacterium]|nr:50S ribosomal protein L1 [Candidatus Daviesbacteria bacterium]